MRSLPILSRRGFAASAGLTLTAVCFGHDKGGLSNGRDGPVRAIRKAGAAARVTVQAIRGDVSVLEGSGGNIAVLHGPDGKLLVDAGVSEANVRAAVDGVGGGRGPIRYVVNTHWHFDHTDGNAWLNAAGATIVGHENARRRMSVATRVEGWDFTFPPSPAGALPTITIRDQATLHVNGAAVAVKAYAPGHTDTDVRVALADADVVHVGDTWWNGHYPFIDYSTGGSIDGAILAADANVESAGERTLVIPGHGPVGGKRELTEFRDMLRPIRDGVAALKKQGRSVDEAVAARPTARFDAKWGTFVIGPDAFTRLVYAGV